MVETKGEYYHEIQACISCLGFMENGEYKKEPDVEDSIKDLLRYLRKEKSDSCSVRRELGRAKIVVSDLIPLLKTYAEDNSLFELVMRLLMNLTQPAIICFRNEIPKDKIRLGYFLELESILREYKLGFADVALMRVLCEKVSALMERDWADRSEDDKLLIERILIVIRNILHISQDVSNEKMLDTEVSVHDQVLWSMRQAGWDTLLLFLSNSDAEQSAFAFHTLEIMSLLFREQDPSVLAKAGVTEASSKKDPDKISLERNLEREAALKRQKAMELSFRHNRFGGCYELRGKTALDAKRDVIYHHNPLEVDRSFDRDKQRARVARNRAPLREREFTRRSSLAVRLFLRELGLRFLQHCYNPLLRTAMAGLMREATMENDETYFMWAMRFFMSFCRHVKPGEIHLISETLNVATFHWLFNQITNYLDKLMSDKKSGVQWSRRLQLAVGAYREMLECLAAVDRNCDEELRKTAHTLKSNVFYMPEYREIFPHLLKRFNQKIQNRSYLCDLVEGTHLLIKLLDSHVSASGGALLVQGKKKMKKKKPAVKTPTSASWTPERLDTVWLAQVDQITSGIRGEVDLPDSSDLPSIFDATTAEGGTEDHADAIRKALVVIQDELRSEKPLRALALLRLAKSLWPEQEALAMEDELLALRDIHLTPLERPEEPVQAVQEEEEDQVAEEPSEPTVSLATECQFDMSSYVLQFAQPTVVAAYVTLLEEYPRNSDRTNASILKMLHRLAVKLDLPALFFQLRLFRVFHRLLNEDPAGRSVRDHDPLNELRKFAIFILRRFFTLLTRNEKLAVDVLFSKSVAEARQIAACDYHKEEHKGPAWSEALDIELRALYEELRGEDVGPGGSVADLICTRFSDKSKTKRAIVGRLRRLGLIESAKELKSRRTIDEADSAPHEWTEEQVEEVRERVASIGPNQPKPLNVLFGALSFSVRFKELKAFLLRTGMAPPSWRLRRSRAAKSGGARAEEAQDPRLLVDTSSSSSSSDEDEDVGLQSVMGELMSVDKDFLLWLAGELSSMLAEVEVPEEGLALVPIEAAHAAAVADPSVQRILRACRLVAPDASARFWRLPRRYLGPEGRHVLASKVEWLQRAAAGEDLTEKLNASRLSKLSSAASDSSSDVSSPDEEFLRKLVAGRRKSGGASSDDAQEPSRKAKPRKAPRKKTTQREEEDSSSEEEEEQRKRKQKPARKKMIRITDITFSSNDEEEEREERRDELQEEKRQEEEEGGEKEQNDKSDESLPASPKNAVKRSTLRHRNKRRSVIVESSDDNSSDSSPVVNAISDESNEDSEVAMNKKIAKRRLITDDSEDEDAENEENKENVDVPSVEPSSLGTSKLLLSDSEGEACGGSQPLAKKRRVIFSDMSDSE